ncbi:unnamed protein product [Aphanomyces euteiches]|uniref:TLDc domain-containing protein n=1 Tax=Aphanomyces euteiches TaxID=100861 RepID=A0A6G0WMM0_9STRA|nr:hypothetical protein Ae201684_013526 [Aphanomyces euteiches]KAH9094428.1 hypothetical protein Ae201684P_017036 [Aphanomyces euteiches]KAH9140953.1 hypothetical protein AeRB84_014846 [Aphanomyces euteiches]
MGNKSSKPTAQEIEELKGPFSDEEFESLQALVSATQADKATFLERFSLGPLSGTTDDILVHFGEALYAAFATLADDPEATELSIAHVAKAAAQCIRSSSSTILRSMFSIFDASHSGELTQEQVQQLFVTCFLMADACNGDVAEKDVRRYTPVAHAIVDAFQVHATHITPSTLTSWAGTHAPLLHTIFSSWMSQRCLPKRSKISYISPQLSHPSDVLSRGQVLALSTQSVDLQHSWDRLYTSTQDGLSFNRLSYHLLGYTGPTLLVCTATDGATFGAYGDTPWKEGTKFFGGPGCFLFRLSPTFLLCPASAAQGLTNYMYYNTKGVVLPRGLGFGGTTSKFRLFLDDELDNCYTSLKCGSYEPGSISLKATFQIQTLEVWGCGGEESKLAQRGYRAETAELINRARKVDKAQFVGNSFDREMFLGKTFGHGTDAARIADDEH